MLVLYCPNLNVIWGYRIKIHIFEIIVRGLDEFLVCSQSRRQMLQILLFWPVVLFFGRIVSNHKSNFVCTITTVLFVSINLFLTYRQTFARFGKVLLTENNYF